MTPIEKILRNEIGRSGPMTVARYMELCLGHPDYGFYAAGAAIGAEGAFVTAPEVSQMFGELIGLWAAQVWMDQGARPETRLVELGPGRGTLMADALRAVGKAGWHPKPVLVETSARLRAEQAERVPDADWVADIREMPRVPSIVIANEFFDALPIRQFQRIDTIWTERVVDVRDGALAFGRVPNAIPGLPPGSPDGTWIEVPEVALAMMTRLGKHLSAQGGAVLIVDYGGEAGAGDTLQAVASHRIVDPLASPGQADLSAHVQFDRLAEAAGLTSSPVLSQREFLGALGLGQRAEQLVAAGADAERIGQDLHRLTAEEEMGTLFRVMGLRPTDAPPLPVLET